MRGLIWAPVAAALLAPVQAQAQTAPAGIADPATIGEGFLAELKRGDVESALNGIEKSSPLMFKFQPDMRGKFVTQISASMSTYGPVARWERIKSEMLGTLMRRDTYLVQHRDIVVRWQFIYMKLERGWGLSYFGFEDQPKTWFD
jgi:hypothetical protein